MHCPTAQTFVSMWRVFFSTLLNLTNEHTHTQASTQSWRSPGGQGWNFHTPRSSEPIQYSRQWGSRTPTQSRVCLHAVGRSLSHTDRNQPRTHAEIHWRLSPNTSSQPMQACGVGSHGAGARWKHTHGLSPECNAHLFPLIQMLKKLRHRKNFLFA